MFRRPSGVALVLVAASVLLLTTAFGQRISESIQRVLVTNFPDPFPVHGTVGIEGPVRLGSFVALDETLVSPGIRPDDIGDLVDGGVLDASGFTSITLSLAVEAKGEPSGPPLGAGALLVPDVEIAERAFREEARLLFPLEVRAVVTPGRRYTASEQPTFTLAFPRYRVYYYNASRKSVSVRLFAYLAAR